MPPMKMDKLTPGDTSDPKGAKKLPPWLKQAKKK